MAGQDKFAKVSSYYCKGAGAAILAYDITDSHSFEQLSNYLESIKSSQEPDTIRLVIVGTKLDLVQENPEFRQVSCEEARRFSDTVNAVFFETSARTNINVENVFDHIGMAIYPQALITSKYPIDDSPILSNHDISPSTNRNTRTCQNQCCTIQ